METTTQEPQFEIVPASAGLDAPAKLSLEEAFSGYFREAEQLTLKAEGITDAKEARSLRLELKRVRVAAEKERKRLKEDSLRTGKAIDGANNILLSRIVPIEQQLDDIERAEERRIAAELQKKTEDRLAELMPLLEEGAPVPTVAQWTDEQFARTLADAKFLKGARIAAQEKLEAERVAAEEKKEAERVAKKKQQDAERAAAEKERERARIENEKLREAAEKREVEIAAERAAAEKAREEAAAVAAAKLKKERAKAEEIQKETEAREAQMKKEREAAEAKATAERVAREKVEADAKEEARKVKVREQIKLEAIRKEEEAKAKAPDKAKLIELAEEMKAIKIPEFTDESLNFEVGAVLQAAEDSLRATAKEL